MEIDLYGLIAVMLSLPAIFGFLYLVKNIKRLKDIWNLVKHRARCVKVHFRLRNNTVIDRYIVPDEHGMMFIDGGMYNYDAKLAVFNKRQRMWEITLLENQFVSERGELHEREVEALVMVVNSDGVQQEVTKKVPQYLINYAGIIPKKVILPAEVDEKGRVLQPEEHLGAKELNDFSETHVSRDIMTATAQEMSYMKYAMMLSGIACVLILIVGVALYSKLGNIQAALDTANAIRQATGK